MCKLFISHSEKDNKEVKDFINFLVLGMNIPREDVFSISLCNTIQSGRVFAEKIKSALLTAEKIICFITPNYLQSQFCLTELGAAWVQQEKMIPLLFPPVVYADLNRTPLLGIQMRRCDSQTDLMAVYDELCGAGMVNERCTDEFNRQLDLYLHKLKELPVLEPDSGGYYVARIDGVRNVPKDYRCYKIHGLLKLNESVSQDESHWIFYRRGIYDDLKVGDTIKFLVGNTELKHFSDIGDARNIYPDVLEIL